MSFGKEVVSGGPAPTPLDIQKNFASQVSDIQAMIGQQNRMAAASEQLVDCLMAEMFGS